MDTETVQTQYGDVSVDVGTCDECGQTIKEDKLYEYVMIVDGEERSGHVCEYCADTGVSSIPLRDQFFAYFEDSIGENALSVFIMLTITLPVMLPALLLDGGVETHAKWVMTGTMIGTVIWTSLTWMIYMM